MIFEFISSQCERVTNRSVGRVWLWDPISEMLKLSTVARQVPSSVVNPDPAYPVILELTRSRSAQAKKNARSDLIRISKFTTLVHAIPYSSTLDLNLPVRATRIEYSGTTDSCNIGFLLKYLLDLQQYMYYCISDMFNKNFFHWHQYDYFTSQYRYAQ